MHRPHAPSPRPQVTDITGEHIDVQAAYTFLLAAHDYQNIEPRAVEQHNLLLAGLGSPTAYEPGGVLHEYEARRETLIASLASLLGCDATYLDGGLS